jgi:hypothetical protein
MTQEHSDREEINDPRVVTDFYGCIIAAAKAAMERGIDPTSQKMIDAICTAVPSASQAEIDKALCRHSECDQEARDQESQRGTT